MHHTGRPFTQLRLHKLALRTINVPTAHVIRAKIGNVRRSPGNTDIPTSVVISWLLYVVRAENNASLSASLHPDKVSKWGTI
jgi:hypothetical protein